MKQPWSKRAKIIRNMLIIFLAAVLIYVAAGSPILFPRLRMCTEEKQAAIGPSVIIDELSSNEYPEFKKLLVGETEYGYVFYSIRGWTSDTLSYRKKAGDMTLLAAPTSWENWHTDAQERTLPIYLFHEYPTAVRAELDLTIIGDRSDPAYYDAAFTRHYSLDATWENNQFFLFYIHVPAAETELGIEGLAPQLFSEICHSSSAYSASQKAYATVRLYGTNDALLAEKKLVIGSIMAEIPGK